MAGMFSPGHFLQHKICNFSKHLDKRQSQKFRSVSSTKVNPNLLDNWYFGNPVNQRGQTEYTGAGMTIDRWMSDNGVTLIINQGAITITDATGNYNSGIKQIIENQIDDVCTFSWLIKSVSGTPDSNGSYGVIFTDNYPSVMVKGAGIVAYTGKVSKSFRIWLCPGCSLEIAAAKLELGTQQTLAHQDADGKWVLNELPNYGEQLARCQRYRMPYEIYAQWIATQIQNDYIDFSIYLPVTMRARPSIEGTSNLKVNTTSGSVLASDFEFYVVAFSSNNVRVRAKKAGHGYTNANLELTGPIAFNSEL